MLYYNPTTQLYADDAELRKELNISFSSESDLSSYGWYQVKQQPQPDYDWMTQKVVEDAPTLDERFALQTWSVVAMTSEELAALLEERRQRKQWSVDDEFHARVSQVNEHIAHGRDGLEMAEATLKAARDLAEHTTKAFVQWVRENTNLNPPDSIWDVAGPEFVDVLRAQPEFDAILDLRTVYEAKKAEIDAASTVAEVEAIDAFAGWPE